MITPVIVQLQWDGWTDRLIMPPDYLRLSTQERRLITLDELRSWTPKEMRHVPDWGIARLFAATMLPGFNPSRCISGVGEGFKVYSRIFLTDTALTTWKVPDDWNNLDNYVECLGPGASGGNGNQGVLAKGGGGGDGGGGGVYAALSNIVFAKDGTGAFPITNIHVGAVGSDTWFKDVATIIAKGAVGQLAGDIALSIGDVKTAGGLGGNNGGGGDRVSGAPGYFYAGGGGGGGGGGAGPGGPLGVGENGFNGSSGKDGTNGPGNPGGGAAGGDGGAPNGGIGGGGGNPGGGAGLPGTGWDADHGTGGGGGGGDGGKGGYKLYSQNNPVSAKDGSGAGPGALYGAGGGGGGGGGSGQSGYTGSGGGRDVGRQGLIVIANNTAQSP